MSPRYRDPWHSSRRPEASTTRPTVAFAHVDSAADQSSKAALNALTVLHAVDLRAEGILVNTDSPGYRATDLSRAPTPGAGDPAEGAVVVV